MQEKLIGKAIGNKTIKVIMSLLLMLALLGAITASPPPAAAAVADETIRHDQIVERNSLMIMSSEMLDLSKGKTPQPIEVVAKSSADIKVTKLTKAHPSERNYVRAHIAEYRKGVIDSIAEEYAKGLTIEFPSVNKAGATGWVTLKYPLVGTHNNKLIGARITYTVERTADKNVPRSIWGGTIVWDYGYAAMQVCDSLFGGVDTWNTKQVDMDIEFFYADSGATVPINESTFVTLGSLNWWEGVGGGEDNAEFVIAHDGRASKIQVPSSTDPKTLGNTKIASLGNSKIGYGYRDTDWDDLINDSRFYKQSVSVYAANGASKIKLTVGGGYQLASKTFDGDGLWFSLSSGSVAIPKPLPPTKKVDKDSTIVGDTLTYTVEQQVHTAGVDIQGKYESMRFTDRLPAEVDYNSGSAKMYRVTNKGAVTEITTTAGGFAYNDTAHTLTYTFNAAYLKAMLMDGETYRMVFSTTVTDRALVGKKLTNKAVVVVNNFEQEAQATTTVIDTTKPTKVVDKPVAQVGEKVTYTVDQPVLDKYPGKFKSFVFFDRLPREVDYVEGSMRLYQLATDGTLTDITDTAGTFEYQAREHTFSYTFGQSYLKSMLMAGETYRIVFDAVVNDQAVMDTPFENLAIVYINGVGQNATAQTTPFEPEPPVKTIDKENVCVGDPVKYTISQKAPTLDANKLTSFVIVDTLPVEVDYCKDSATMQQFDADGNELDLPEDAGTFQYDETAHTLTYTFTPEYLAIMPLTGETYQITFNALINEKAAIDQEIINEATVSMNEIEHKVTATTIPRKQRIEVVKACTPETGSYVRSGDTITYYLTVRNTGLADAYEVAVQDNVPEYTFYTEHERSFEGTYFNDTNSVGWKIPELKVGEEKTVGFSVVVQDDLPDEATIKNMATYSPDAPEVPSQPLNDKTNEVKQEIEPSKPVDKIVEVEPEIASGKTYDKTGNILIDYLWVFAVLGLALLGAGVYTLYHWRKRRQMLSRIIYR